MRPGGVASAAEMNEPPSTTMAAKRNGFAIRRELFMIFPWLNWKFLLRSWLWPATERVVPPRQEPGPRPFAAALSNCRRRCVTNYRKMCESISSAFLGGAPARHALAPQERASNSRARPGVSCSPALPKVSLSTRANNGHPMNTNSKTDRLAAATVRDVRWAAVVARDARAVGAFFYSVRTTGVYCRPSCAARSARPENVAFHATTSDADPSRTRTPCSTRSAREHVERTAFTSWLTKKK